MDWSIGRLSLNNEPGLAADGRFGNVSAYLEMYWQIGRELALDCRLVMDWQIGPGLA